MKLVAGPVAPARSGCFSPLAIGEVVEAHAAQNPPPPPACFSPLAIGEVVEAAYFSPFLERVEVVMRLASPWRTAFILPAGYARKSRRGCVSRQFAARIGRHFAGAGPTDGASSDVIPRKRAPGRLANRRAFAAAASLAVMGHAAAAVPVPPPARGRVPTRARGLPPSAPSRESRP